jgi:hypothetical protein
LLVLPHFSFLNSCFCPGALSSVFIWVSCMYVVAFAPLIILEIMFLPRCIVICVHFGLMYVRCWFWPANISFKCVFAPVNCSQGSFGTRVCTLLVLPH